MQAVILAAGKSQRFYPFTSLPHKSLISLMGKSLLQRTLESLKESNVTDVIIVVGENSPIPDLISSVPGLSIQYIVQKETLGMGHALLSAKDKLEDSFFLLSAYHFECNDFIPELLKARNETHDVVLLAKEDTILEQYGVLEVEGDTVIDIIEKPSDRLEKAFRVIGIYLLSKNFLDTLSHISLEHYHFEKALASHAKKGHVGYVTALAPTITLKYAWDLLSVKDLLLQRLTPFISEHAEISSHAILSGPVYISDGAKILEGACIKGPCFIGENVTIGNNAILRNGVLLERDVVIGATMEVKNSIIFENVTTHTGFIGDSVIGAHSKVAAGFLSANVRLDREHIYSIVRQENVNTYRTHVGVIAGQHTNFGVNTTVMPGIIVGNNVTIGPSTVVMQNIEDDSLYYTKFDTVVKKKHE